MFFKSKREKQIEGCWRKKIERGNEIGRKSEREREREINKEIIGTSSSASTRQFLLLHLLLRRHHHLHHHRCLEPGEDVVNFVRIQQHVVENVRRQLLAQLFKREPVEYSNSIHQSFVTIFRSLLINNQPRKYRICFLISNSNYNHATVTLSYWRGND